MAATNSMRTCVDCKGTFPKTVDYFHTKKQRITPKNPEGFDVRCYQCGNKYRRKYKDGRKPNPPSHKTARKTTEEVRRHRARLKHGNRVLKLQVLQAYSGDVPFCQCCGEKSFEFLTIDHIANDGAAHRRSLNNGKGGNVYIFLRKNGFPDGFRVLCMNCNFAIGRYGYCPHQEEGIDISTLKPKYRHTKYWSNVRNLKREVPADAVFQAFLFDDVQ